VQKRLNQLICHLGCGLKWAEGSISSIVFARWRQCALMGGDILDTWRIQLNCPSAAAMWPYVKLLWPLLIIIRRYRSTTSVNAAYCYRVAWSVSQSVCRSVTLVSPAKRLNRSRCRLGCGLGWSEGSASSIIFARWRQCAHIGGHIGATWQIRLNRLSVAVMRPYVKLLWPAII